MFQAAVFQDGFQTKAALTDLTFQISLSQFLYGLSPTHIYGEEAIFITYTSNGISAEKTPVVDLVLSPCLCATKVHLHKLPGTRCRKAGSGVRTLNAEICSGVSICSYTEPETIGVEIRDAFVYDRLSLVDC